MSPSPFWRVPPGAQLLWRHWPGEAEYVFYHGAAGDTHRLTEAAGLMLERILAGEGDADGLFRTLQAAGYDLTGDDLAGLLRGLADLDLIEAAGASG